MNTKILVSVLIIGLTAAAIGGGMTGAFFSDTETSSGNTFTAGAIDLKVDNHCYYNGMECKKADGDNEYHWNGDVNEDKCTCTWDLTDLANELFFDFADLKPGDHGEDTISLHVHDNDAWACAAIAITKNDDVDCTEPENEEVGGENGACNNNNPSSEFDGDLAQELYFVFWVDDGDNVYEPDDGETILMNGYASDIIDQGAVVYTLADSQENNVGEQDGKPLEGDQTYHIGKMWCFGTLNWCYNTSSTAWTCDGSSVDNKPQTDEVQGNIIFYAVQERNNGNFQCGNWNVGGS